MPSEQLEYFNLGARGQYIRLAYLIGGLDFDDKRYEFSEWPTRKESTPLGQLPVLTIDGTEFTQSVGMLRYVGGKSGIYPAPGTKDQLIVEDILETMNEIWSKTPKESERREYLDNQVAKAFAHVEKISKADTAFCTGDDITVADLFIYGYIHFFGSGFWDSITADDFAKYTFIQKICTSVKNHPKLKEYIGAGKF
eukprot:gb/GEZJ01008481.1/.p1 GENE.gb/GEZJ01008481.1/~~gb/GEZJ01008481.1/.p1  ORF type:complete len:208 (-),score=27.89 gb/GEZJ01008481.1/:63-650(-)